MWRSVSLKFSDVEDLSAEVLWLPGRTSLPSLKTWVSCCLVGRSCAKSRLGLWQRPLTLLWGAVTLSLHLLRALAAILDVLLCFPLSVPKSRKNNVLENGNSSVLNPNNRLMYSWGQGSLRVNGALAGQCQRLWLQTEAFVSHDCLSFCKYKYSLQNRGQQLF